MNQALARIGWLACVVGVAIAGAGRTAAAEVRDRLSFNAGWRFTKGDPAGADLSYAAMKPYLLATGAPFARDNPPPSRPASNPGEDVAYTQAAFDDAAWRTLDLPHDWAIEGPFVQAYEGATGKREYWGVGWYRKHFTLPAADQGKRIRLDFDGAMSHAAVWVNGHFAGGWPYGYASFALDITPFIKPGADNVVAVRLDNPRESSRWYPGAGIYRNVWLVKTDPVHVDHWGTYVTTPEVSADAATVEVKATVRNDSAAPADATITTHLYAAGSDGRPTGSAVADAGPASLTLPPNATATADQHAKINHPKLWSLQSPARYVAVTTVEQGGKVVDEYATPFGVRTIAFTADRGFLLNGHRVRINGVCQHHDLGLLGAAFNTRAAERQIQILQEMGCNAIRTSHNPPAPELLDLCDRMGMLVMDEAFDCWAIAKRPGDYATLYPDWHEIDWRAQIRRDRNHPCVVLWSTGNELREFRQSKVDGQKTSAELTRIAHEEDPTRLTSFGCNSADAGYNGYQKTVDVFGLNYRPAEYKKFVAKNPTIPLLGSETSSCVSTRGEYVFPVEEDKAKGLSADFQVSSYDLYAPPWATTPDAEFEQLDRFPTAVGEFVWTGFDYLGEPTPFNKDVTNLLNFSDPAERARMEEELSRIGKISPPSRSSYFGIVDLCGFKKDRFYLYQARWRPDLPMAHILPHWNWPDRAGQVTPVHVYTSGDSAELFLNRQSLGKKTKGQYQYRLRWDDVKYQPGELKVVAYKDGQKWAEDTVKTTGPAVKLTAQPDRRTLTADGADLSFITITLTDKDGLTDPLAHNLLHFSLEGPGEIVAVDNGDPTEHRSFQSADYPAFHGLCLVIIRTKPGHPGPLTLKVRGDGLAGTETTLVSR